jgi:multidrug resistance efflux pump
MPNDKRTSGVNWFYGFIAVIFALMIWISAKYFRGSDYSCIGITEVKEYKINSEKSGLVKSVHVVPGQQVKAGELLLDLTSAELDMNIEKITNRITLLKVEQQSKAKLIQAQVDYLHADLGIPLEEIETEIDQTKSEIQLNKKLTKELATNSDTSVWNEADNPLQVKLSSLQKQKAKHNQAIRIKETDIRQEGFIDQQQLNNQISLLEQELELLKTEKHKLVKYAAADGVVKSVYIKPGEQVSGFTPLLSITPVSPTTVIGYLAGKNNNAFAVGDSVRVSAYGDGSIRIMGKVIGYGSVIELPDILQKSTAVKAFGREIFIEIPPQNKFASGEKVLIR